MVKFIEFVTLDNDIFIIKLENYSAAYEHSTDEYFICAKLVTPKEYGRVRQLMIDYQYLVIPKERIPNRR